MSHDLADYDSTEHYSPTDTMQTQPILPIASDVGARRVRPWVVARAAPQTERDVLMAAS